jgi:hypothetical protein
MNNDTRISRSPGAPEFQPGGMVNVRATATADRATISTRRALTFGLIAMTRDVRPDQGHRFARLAAVSGQLFRQRPRAHAEGRLRSMIFTTMRSDASRKQGPARG